MLEIRQERQETNWKLEGGAFCTSRLQGEKLHLVAIFLGGAGADGPQRQRQRQKLHLVAIFLGGGGADGPAPGKREAILGKFQSMVARDASKQDCIRNKKIQLMLEKRNHSIRMV